MTIRFLLERAVEKSPTRIALKYRRDTQWQTKTYQEFELGVRQMSEAFHSIGMQANRGCAALIIENSPEWMESYLALTGVGITVVPIDPKLRADEIRYILNDAGVSLAIIQKEHRAIFEAVCADLPNLRNIVVIDAQLPLAFEIPSIACHDYDSLKASVAENKFDFYARHPVNPQDVASIIYTSGTTGKPKGAMLTHNNFCSDAAGSLEWMKNLATPNDDFLIVLPLFHSFSFLTNFVLPMYCMSGMFFVESLRTVADDINVLRPTLIMAVPLLVEKLLAKIEAKIETSRFATFLLKIGLGAIVGKKVMKNLGGRLRLFVVGGAPCPVHVLKGFMRLGVPVVEGYGLTECSPVVAVNPLKNPRVGSIGKPIANITVRIANPNENGVGELQVRGPIVMKGYYNNPEATREAFDGDWLRTGDLAIMGKDGFISICGRKKALIVNREGKNIYPEEVETILARHPFISDIVVIGYTVGDVKGERVGAIVTPNLEAITASQQGVEPSWAEVEKIIKTIIAEQSKALAEYKHIRKLVIHRDPLERTSIQKVRRVAYQGKLDEP